MIRIAFCDDDSRDLDMMHSLVEEYCAERGRTLSTEYYHSPLDLLAKMEQHLRYDIVFLDILMPGENGIDTAREIRSHDKNVKIIFLTSSAEFAVQSYSVKAWNYQMKPLQRESFFPLLDDVLSECEKEKENVMVLRCKNEIIRIAPNRIEYCEIAHRTLFIHLTSGKTLESVGSMEELSNLLLPYGCFIRPHRSYIANLSHIQSIAHNTITMHCLDEIPIARGKYKEIKNAFLEHAFRNSEVTL